MPLSESQLAEWERLAAEATPIAAWPGYAVTRCGKVYSYASNWRGYGIRELVQTPDRHGYMRVAMMDSGTRKKRNKPVHRLVMDTFVGPKPNPKAQTRHLDGDKHNNHVSNLAWGTPQENGADKVRLGEAARGDRNGARARPERLARGERQGASKLTAQAVHEIREAMSKGASGHRLAKQYGVNNTTIYRVRNGKQWTSVA